MTPTIESNQIANQIDASITLPNTRCRLPTHQGSTIHNICRNTLKILVKSHTPPVTSRIITPIAFPGLLGRVKQPSRLAESYSMAYFQQVMGVATNICLNAASVALLCKKKSSLTFSRGFWYDRFFFVNSKKLLHNHLSIALLFFQCCKSFLHDYNIFLKNILHYYFNGTFLLHG